MKRKFSFRLERVLRVRAIEERVARAEWGAAQAELRSAQEKRDERSRGLADARQEMGQGRFDGSISAPQALLAERALDSQMFGLTNASEQVASKSLHAEQLANAWRTREQSRKALVELQSRAQLAHRLELEAGDNAEMDEQAIGSQKRLRQTKRDFPSPTRDSEICSSYAPPTAE